MTCVACPSSSSAAASSSISSPRSRLGRMIVVGASAGSCATGQVSSVASLSKYVGLPCSRRRRSRASRRSLPLPLGVLHAGSIGRAVLPSPRPRIAGLFRDAEHQAAGEARPPGDAAAAGEPPLALDREDAHAAPERGGRRRRRDGDRARGTASSFSWLDRAAANGALHRNTVARRKSQAAKLVAGAARPT